VVRFGEDSSVVQGLSIVASLVVFATNSFLSFMIEKIAKYEKHTTHTHYLRGIAEKLAIVRISLWREKFFNDLFRHNF